jgi:hypothetical protein
VASLPASFIQQAPSGQEGRVCSYKQVQGYQPDYSHAPSLAAKPGAGTTHIMQHCKPLLVHGSIQCQLCSKPRAIYAARSFLTMSEEAGMHKCFAAEQLDVACDDDDQYACGSQLFPTGHKLDEAVYCNYRHAARWWSPTSTKPTLPLSTSQQTALQCRCAARAASSTWHRSALSSLTATRPCRRLLGSVGLGNKTKNPSTNQERERSRPRDSEGSTLSEASQAASACSQWKCVEHAGQSQLAMHRRACRDSEGSPHP